jgi:hypothetical protein
MREYIVQDLVEWEGVEGYRLEWGRRGRVRECESVRRGGVATRWALREYTREEEFNFRLWDHHKISDISP